MNRSLSIFIWSMLVLLDASAQKEWSFGNYQYLGQQAATGIVPVMQFETRYNWFTAVRYNYEEQETFSALTGYSFHGGKDWKYRVTPVAGFSAGRFNGWSFGMNGEITKGIFYISTENQYSMSVDRNNDSFVCSWSEAGFDILKYGLIGVSVQYYRQAARQTLVPGIMTGLRFNKLVLPVYFFEPFRSGRYFVIGVCYEFVR